MNKSEVKTLLTFLSLFVLIIPIGISGYIGDAQITNILSKQGDYSIGETIGLYDGSKNMTEIIDGIIDIPNDDPLGWDADNDTIFQGYKSTGLQELRDSTYYGQYITYAGAGEHTMVVDWDDMNVTVYDDLRYLYIPLNYTNADFAEFDFVRFHSDFDKTDGANVRLYYQRSATQLGQINPTVLDSEKDIFINTLNYKNEMNNYPNGTIFLTLWAIEDNFNETQTSFTWILEGNALKTTDYVFGSELTDSAIWLTMIVSMIAIYIYVAVYGNAMIDNVIDNRKPKSKRRK